MDATRFDVKCCTMEKSTRNLVVVQPNSKALPESLTYYDPELQNAWNVEPHDAERLAAAIAKSRVLQRKYMKQLTKLRPRLNQRTYARFAAESDSLFDSNLLEFTFGDHLNFAAKARRKRPRTTVRATFLSFDENTLHELRYRDIESVRVNVPEERWFEWPNTDGRKQIDSLLSHELTGSGQHLMRHKFLFASGATISIGFARIAWGTQRISKH